jgi:threonyl-tRNA synthetase
MPNSQSSHSILLHYSSCSSQLSGLAWSDDKADHHEHQGLSCQMTYVTHIQYKNWNLQSISLESGDTCWIFYGLKIYKELRSLIQTKLVAHGFRNNSQLGLTSLWENCVWWLYFKSLTCDTLLALKIMMCNICIELLYNFGFLSQQSNVSVSTLEYFLSSR